MTRRRSGQSTHIEHEEIPRRGVLHVLPGPRVVFHLPEQAVSLALHETGQADDGIDGHKAHRNSAFIIASWQWCTMPEAEEKCSVSGMFYGGDTIIAHHTTNIMANPSKDANHRLCAF